MLGILTPPGGQIRLPYRALGDLTPPSMHAMIGPAGQATITDTYKPVSRRCLVACGRS